MSMSLDRSSKVPKHVVLGGLIEDWRRDLATHRSDVGRDIQVFDGAHGVLVVDGAHDRNAPVRRLNHRLDQGLPLVLAELRTLAHGGSDLQHRLALHETLLNPELRRRGHEAIVDVVVLVKGRRHGRHDPAHLPANLFSLHVLGLTSVGVERV